MTLAIPNTFFPGAAINAAQIEANNNAIKNQCNGGINAADIASPAGIDLQHIMNGEYLPTNIDYDMTSGHEIGAQELPRMLVGALPKYWGNTSRRPKTIPRTGTTFYLKQPANIVVRFDAFVKGYESELTSPFSVNYSNIFIDIDGVFYSVTKYVFSEELDWGAGVGGGLIPSWERRRSYNGHFVLYNQAAGEHTVSLAGNSDAQAFFIKNLSFTIEVHYT